MSAHSKTKFTPSDDTGTVHFLEIDYGKAGRAFRETDPVFTEREAVHLITSGEEDRPVLRVLAVNLNEGWSRDVTEDIASLVFYHFDGEGDFSSMTSAARAFVERFGHDVEECERLIESNAINWARHQSSLSASL